MTLKEFRNELTDGILEMARELEGDVGERERREMSRSATPSVGPVHRNDVDYEWFCRTMKDYRLKFWNTHGIQFYKKQSTQCVFNGCRKKPQMGCHKCGKLCKNHFYTCHVNMMPLTYLNSYNAFLRS